MSKFINLLAIIVTLQCTAYADRGITASGEPVRAGICAMDRLNGVIVPFGSRVTLPDGRVLTVTDRFGDGRSNALDIFMQTEDECWNFGRRNLVCEVEVAE